MSFYNLFNNGKSKSDTCLFPLLRDPEKLFKNLWKVFLRNAVAGIRYRKVNPLVINPGRESDLSSRTCVFQCIGKEIAEDMVHSGRINPHLRQVSRQIN